MTDMMMAVSSGRTIHGIDPERPKEDLLEKVYGESAVPMFIDKKDGSTAHIGYVVKFGPEYADEWFTLYNVAHWEGEED